MASLTEISIISRKIIRYGFYLLVLFLVARTLFNFGKTVYLRIFPPAPPEPDVAFGVLPELPFPIKNPTDLKKIEGLEFKLETVDGSLPTLPEQVLVYEMPPLPQKINALDEAKSIATKLGFDELTGKPALESTPNVYIFQKKSIPSTLTINIVTGIFSVYYDFNQDPSVLTGVPPTAESAVQQIVSYLGNGILSSDISNGRSSHQYVKAEGNNLIPVESLSEANLIKVNLFRKNYGKEENIESVTPDLPEANVWFLTGRNSRQIVRGEYHYYPINESKSGSYPIKTADEAWQDLSEKKAFIVSFDSTGNEKVTIRKVYLGYYDAGQYQEFYQPVVVFEGDGGFIAYVPAIKSNFYGKDKNQ